MCSCARFVAMLRRWSPPSAIWGKSSASWRRWWLSSARWCRGEPGRQWARKLPLSRHRSRGRRRLHPAVLTSLAGLFVSPRHRIDQNVEEVDTNVNAAQDEVSDSREEQRGYRRSLSFDRPCARLARQASVRHSSLPLARARLTVCTHSACGALTASRLQLFKYLQSISSNRRAIARRAINGSTAPGKACPKQF